MVLNSVAGLLALLEDYNPVDVQQYALKRLDDLVDQHWPEVSDSVDKLEILYENRKSKLAALIASKVYYHLNGFDESLHYALLAEDLIDIDDSSLFVETVISTCIDKYIELRQAYESNAGDFDGSAMDVDQKVLYDRLQPVVHKLFYRCLSHKEYTQALGIAIESRNRDFLKACLDMAEDKKMILDMAYKLACTVLSPSPFRVELLRLVATINFKTKPPDYLNLLSCYMALCDYKSAAFLFERMIRGSEDEFGTALQGAFDTLESGNQGFRRNLINFLLKRSFFSTVAENNKDQWAERFASFTSFKVRTEKNTSSYNSADVEDDFLLPSDEDVERLIEAVEEGSVELPEATLLDRLEKLVVIISGDKLIELEMQFLIKNNATDMRVLDRLKNEVRQSVTHNATVIANGFMHFGTTSDQFLRENLDWLAKAVNWAKFTAISTLGVIHNGHERDALKLMNAYLPKDGGGTGTSPYVEGGSLYALGLMHAGHGSKVIEYLQEKLKNCQDERVRHGGLLGLGLASMMNPSDDRYVQMIDNLLHDDAVTSEAAGIAIGLMCMGTGDLEASEDLYKFAGDTQHEKIRRGCALGAALVHAGARRPIYAQKMCDQFCKHKEETLRCGGAAMLGTMYCGTGDHATVRRLLHMAVTDTSDDVKRWAVTSIGFVLCNQPERCPGMVNLLAESFNPHLRYGAAMALAMAVSGHTGPALKGAIQILEPMCNDRSHFVRQGAFITMAMLLMQHNEVTCIKAVELRDKLLAVAVDRHEDMLAKFGAIIALGILQAGGKNVVIRLQNRLGDIDWETVAGLVVFQNYWFWYPLANFISLAFKPTCLIGLNSNLQMPKMNFVSMASPSTFAYMQPLKVEKEKRRDKVETAVLSVTVKEMKHKRKNKTRTGTSDRKAVERKDKPKDEKEALSVKDDEKADGVPAAEPTSSLLTNPARITAAQSNLIALEQDSKYRAVRSVTHGGVVIVKKKDPSSPEELVELVHGNRPEETSEGPEPNPPEPFQWTEEDEKLLFGNNLDKREKRSSKLQSAPEKEKKND